MKKPIGLFLISLMSSEAQALTDAAVNGGSTYYVCVSGTSCGSGWKTGNDSNSKTSARNRLTPWKTIDHALRQALAGDLIVVGSGTYSTLSAGDSYSNIVFKKGGTSTKRLSLKSERKWGAIIDGGGRHSGVRFNCDAAPIPASYIRIDGFVIRNAQSGLIVKDAGNDNGLTRCTNIEITNLKIYGIKFTAMSVESIMSSLIASNLIYSSGSNPKGNQDHGIYLSDNTEDILVKNNVVYGIKYGWPIHIYDGHGKGPAKYHKIINNTLVADNPVRKGGIVMYGSGHTIRNNLIYQRNVASNGYIGAIADRNTTFSGTVIQNNVTNITPLCANGCRLASVTGNLLSQSFSKEFVSASGNNFRLITGAKSIDKGTLSSYGLRNGAPKDDHDNRLRYTGKAPDAGAFEK